MPKCQRPECDNETNTKFCSLSCNSKYQNSIRNSNLVQLNAQRSVKCRDEYDSNPVKCLNCDVHIDYDRKVNKFCSRSCNAIYNNKKRIYKPRTPFKYNLEKNIGKLCKITSVKCECCNDIFIINAAHFRRFCGINCKNRFIGRLGGRKSASIQSEIKRSKNEIYFSELCVNKFDGVLTNVAMFNGWDADVILPNLKIAVMWNGAWHLKKITKNHSLRQVKNRDKIKIKEIVNCGYVPYIIEDSGKYNPEFVDKMFDLFVDYCNIVPISWPNG